DDGKLIAVVYAGSIYLYSPDLGGPPRRLGTETNPKKPTGDPDNYDYVRFVYRDNLLVAYSRGKPTKKGGPTTEGYLGLCQVGKDQTIRKVPFQERLLSAKGEIITKAVIITRAGVVIQTGGLEKDDNMLRLVDFISGKEVKKVLVPTKELDAPLFLA